MLHREGHEASRKPKQQLGGARLQDEHRQREVVHPEAVRAHLLLHDVVLVQLAEQLRGRVQVAQHVAHVVEQVPDLGLDEEAVRARLLGRIAEGVDADEVDAPACHANVRVVPRIGGRGDTARAHAHAIARCTNSRAGEHSAYAASEELLANLAPRHCTAGQALLQQARCSHLGTGVRAAAARRRGGAPLRELLELAVDELAALVAKGVDIDLLLAERAPHLGLLSIRVLDAARRRALLPLVDLVYVLVGRVAAPEVLPLDEHLGKLGLHAARVSTP
jgi:hypothetical protein